MLFNSVAKGSPDVQVEKEYNVIIFFDKDFFKKIDTGIKRFYDTVRGVNSNAFYEMKDVASTLNHIQHIVLSKKQEKLNFVLCLSLSSIRNSLPVIQNSFPVNSIFNAVAHDIDNKKVSGKLYDTVEVLELKDADLSSLKVIARGGINDAGDLVG